MPTITWPTDFPQRFLEDGFRREPHDNLIRSRVSVGPGPTRPRFTAVTEVITGFMPFTGDEFEALQAFYHNDLAFGSLEFDFPDPYSRTDPPETVAVKMRPLPSESEALNRLVRITLDTMPRNPATTAIP